MRSTIACFALLLAFSATSARADGGFIQVHGTQLTLDGKPYHFIGANFWAGMNLGSVGPGGDRARLDRELDRLHALGVDNLRVLGTSQGPDSEPWRISPALESAPGVNDSALLDGLDFLIHEMGKRHMRAVVCLNNFWSWSGGMAQYLAWAGAGPIPYPPPEPGGDWGAFQSYVSQFYSNPRALTESREEIHAIVSRYASDPTVMAWELANEPRGIANTDAFNRWIDETSTYIKSLDPNHLVTTGSEGETPSPASAGVDFVANHRFKNIDYATAHIWAQNWGWFDPARADATYDAAVAGMTAYFRDHIEKAKQLGKPLVVEEFGLARDGGSYDPASATTVRDRYFTAVFEQASRAIEAGEPVAGVNFWAWAGEARPAHPGGHWAEGDPFVGDPPHENQGWYSVYDSDRGTAQVISTYAARLNAALASRLHPTFGSSLKHSDGSVRGRTR